MSNAAAGSHVDLDELPGHYIRRLQQIAVAIFLQETEATGITPVQYAALQMVCNQPGIDQRRRRCEKPLGGPSPARTTGHDQRSNACRAHRPP